MLPMETCPCQKAPKTSRGCPAKTGKALEQIWRVTVGYNWRHAPSGDIFRHGMSGDIFGFTLGASRRVTQNSTAVKHQTGDNPPHELQPRSATSPLRHPAQVPQTRHFQTQKAPHKCPTGNCAPSGSCAMIPAVSDQAKFALTSTLLALLVAPWAYDVQQAVAHHRIPLLPMVCWPCGIVHGTLVALGAAGW